VGPTSDDFQTLDYLQEANRPILLVATKIDRLPKARRKPRLNDLAEQMSLPREAVMPFSATEKLGLEEVWGALLGAVKV
jgi:GTP-binding protein